MKQPCELADAFVDGELDVKEAEKFEFHLADCAECQAQVEQALMLSYLDDRADIGSDVAETIELTWYKRPRNIAVFTAGLAAAAALAFVLLRDSGAGAGDDQIAARFQAALGAERRIDARFSYRGADAHRPYEVMRADGAEIESIPADIIADLEKRNDRNAIAVAYALMGARQRAQVELDKAPDSAAKFSDLAAIRLGSNDANGGLEAAARALEFDSDFAPALWNRAVALERLGLVLASARAFERVAETGEAGWSAEAKTRAARHRSDYEKLKSDWDRATKADQAIASKGTIDEEVLRNRPALLRLGLYDAIAQKSSKADLEKLRPIAKAIDEREATKTAQAHLDRVLEGLSPKRATLVERYSKVAASRRLEDSTLVADAIAASQDDIALAALFYKNRVTREDEAVYRRLATATRDPWFELIAIERIMRSRIFGGDSIAAVAASAGADKHCKRERYDYRCLRINQWLARAHSNLHNFEAAGVAGQRAFDQARRTGDWTMQLPLFSITAIIEARRDDVTGERLAIVSAMVEESFERWPACENAVYEVVTLVETLIARREIDRANLELEALDKRCPDVPKRVRRAAIDVERLAHGADIEPKALEDTITSLRRDAPDQHQKTEALYLQGRLVIRRDPERGESILREVLAEAKSHPTDISSQLRSKVFSSLAASAARNRQFGSAIDLMAEELGFEVATCAVAIVEEADLFVAVKDSDGRALGQRRDMSTPADELVAPFLDSLSACKSIDVLAKAPFIGRVILPARLPWRFRLGGANRAVQDGSHVIVADVQPPADLGLKPLTPSPRRTADTVIAKSAATPTRVMQALQNAAIVEIHAHGVASDDNGGTAALVLSADDEGRFALGTSELEGLSLRRNPIVILSACEAAVVSPNRHAAQSLVGSLLKAGASAVVASPKPIPDRAAYEFFDTVIRQVQQGTAPAVALASARTDNKPWTQQVSVFQ